MAREFTPGPEPSPRNGRAVVLVLVGLAALALLGRAVALGVQTRSSDASVRQQAPLRVDLPEGSFAAGSAGHAQLAIKILAERFAACAARTGDVLVCTDPIEMNLEPAGAFDRVGARGPAEGAGARSGVGVFSEAARGAVHLIQYDAAGRGWGYRFDRRGAVAPECWSIRGQRCRGAKAEKAGAGFLDDAGTADVLRRIAAACEADLDPWLTQAGSQQIDPSRQPGSDRCGGRTAAEIGSGG